MDKLYKSLTSAISNLSILMLVTMTLIVGAAVFTRYTFSSTPAWSEELARLLMVWFSFLAIPLGVSGKFHVKVDILFLALSEKNAKILTFIAEIFICLFGIFLLVKGAALTFGTVGATLPALKLPTPFLYLCVPISGLLIVLASVRNMFGNNPPEEVND
jgi:TRAP-type C4-dicarboxylate transport system permease small subunit